MNTPQDITDEIRSIRRMTRIGVALQACVLLCALTISGTNMYQIFQLRRTTSDTNRIANLALTEATKAANNTEANTRKIEAQNLESAGELRRFVQIWNKLSDDNPSIKVPRSPRTSESPSKILTDNEMTREEQSPPPVSTPAPGKPTKSRTKSYHRRPRPTPAPTFWEKLFPLQP